MPALMVIKTKNVTVVECHKITSLRNPFQRLKHILVEFAKKKKKPKTVDCTTMLSTQLLKIEGKNRIPKYELVKVFPALTAEHLS